MILALPTAAGIVMASDTQYTSGEVRCSGPKIYTLNPNCAWAGAGEIALIQRVQEDIRDISARHGLAEVRDTLAHVVRQAVHALLELDVLTEFGEQVSPYCFRVTHPRFLGSVAALQ